MTHPVFFILAGLAGGLIGGLFGVGGGILVVPILVLLSGFSQTMAQGTMIATFVLPSFLFAAITYYRSGNIHLQAALLIAVGMMLGTFLGAKCAHALPVPVLKKMFGVFIIAVGIKMILGK